MFSMKDFPRKTLKLSSNIVMSRSFCQLNNQKTISGCYKLLKKPKLRTIMAGIHTSGTKGFLERKQMEPTEKELVPRDRQFRGVQTKDKDTFLRLLDVYSEHDKIRRGHIELIYAALKYIEEYGLQYDIEAYNKVLNVFPKGKMIPKNMLQAEFHHYARHQDSAIFALDLMEYNGVFPNSETKEIILAAFGKSTHVYKKYARMMYWMSKLNNINPYQLPDPLPLDARELAWLALKKMTVDRRTVIEEYDAENLEDSLDKTWIVSAQSPVQKKLIKGHSEEEALSVEGPSLVWMKRVSMTYFVLRAEPKIYPKVEIDEDDVSDLRLYMFGEPKPTAMTITPSSVHEQEDGTILAMCCTGTSSKDSLLSWIRFLRKSNPKLDNIPILFKIRTTPTALVAVNVKTKPAASDENTDSSEEPIKQETEKEESNHQDSK